MTKRLNLFILVVLLLGQTVIGPIGSTSGLLSAAEGEANEEVIDKDDAEVKVDREELKELLANADNYEEADYEADSYADFVNAITAGQAVYEDAEATQDDVDEAVSVIEEAIQALQQKTSTDEDGEAEESTGPEDEETEGDDDNSSSMQATSGAQTLAEDDPVYVDEITLTDGEHVKGFTFKVNGHDFVEGETTVSNGDPFELKIDFEELDSQAMNFGPGTVLKYQLPEDFTTHFTGLTVPQRFGQVGTLQIDANTGYVIITLDDGVMEGITVSDIKEGTFTISGKFSDSNDDWNKDINMPGGEKFTVNFKPKQNEGVTINKGNGIPYKGDTQTNQKSDKIEWKVTVNTNLANTADNPVFTDTLSSNATGHKYDTGSVEIREIDVRPNGDTTVGDIAQGISASFDNDDTEMTINLEPGKAYEITYTTIPENPGTNENVTYNNEASYDGTTDRGSAYVDFGKAIEKTTSGPNSDLETEWTIKYNYNEQTIPSGTTVKDEWTTSGTGQSNTNQILIDGNDGITIEGVDGGPSLSQGDYTVNYNETEQKFELTFNTEFDYPINIKYKTKPNDDLKVSENFTVKNDVEHGHIPGAEDSKTVDYNQTSFTLVKNAPGELNYEDKTMNWSITANQAKYPLDAGTRFVDTFGNENMVLVEDSLKVEAGNQELVKGIDYNLTNNNEKGFVIELINGTSEQINITYKTSFDQIKGTIDENRKQNYPNHVVLEESGLPTDPEDSAEHQSNEEQKDNGSKSGTYNYETKEFTWTIIFNYNSNTLTNAILKDALPEEHEITKVTLEKGSINSGGTFVADADQDGVTQPDILGGHEFSQNLGQINQPYRLVYKTKMKDDVLPVDGNSNYSVKNKAELFDGDTPNAEWEATVTVNYSNKVLDQKNGRQVNGTETIAWDFLYNTAQSKLTNVKITDTFGLDNGTPNQLLDEDSLKVYKVTYTSNGQINKEGQELTAGTDYDVSFNTEDGATFVLEFDELNHGIYVEYESVFIGIKDSPISNELAVTYNDGENQTGSSDVPNLNFTYGSFATTSAGKFVVIKTDEATGEPMEGVEFTLKRGTRTIISGETNENGVLDFEMPFATGNYSLEEVTPDGYEPLNNFTFELKADGGPYEGKQIVNVTNTKTTDKDKMCPDFTITVKDVEGNEEANKSVKLVNEKTGQVFEETTDGDGKIVKDREDLPAGNYKVYEVDGNDEIYINDIEVKYVGEDNTECNAEVRPEVTSISGTKTWKDGGLDNDNRPGITIELLADGNKVDSVDLDKNNISADNENVWEYQFENLRLLNNAGTEEIEYTVEELDVSGYKSTQDGNNFTNVRTSDSTIEIPVEKVWVGPEVETKPVTINLLADGTKLTDLVLSEDNDWEGSFKNLAIYDSEGEEIKYTVEEVEVEGYNTKTTGDATDGFTVTNTQKTYAIGDYVWVDYDNNGRQNESEKAVLEGVTVELYDKDEKYITKTTTDENGLYIFDELVAGEYKVKFTLTEEQAKKYRFTEQGADGTDATNDSDAHEKTGWTEVIKLNDDNEHLTKDEDYGAQTVKATEGIDPTWDAGVIELTEVTVNKTWVDDNDATENRPKSIKVNLKQDDKVIEEEVEIKADDNWTHTFTGLTKYASEDEEYVYTVSEHDVPGYASEVNGFEITNTRAEDKSITINKAWLDNNDATENRPDSIEVELFRSVDGAKEFVDKYTVKAEDDWTLTIDELPAFDEDGKAYTYKIEEIEVDGYESTINGFDITNLRVGTTEVSVEKVWEGSEEKSVTINLLANGEIVEPVELSDDNDWKHEFTELPEFDEEGKAIEYTVDEVEIPEYNSEITGDAEEGFIVTNTQKTYAIGDYVWVDRNKDGIQDDNEEPLEGVKVELYDKDGEKIAETETDENGRYIFDDLPAGEYEVKFELTEEQAKKYRFTKEQAGDDTIVDSDANPETGWTRTIDLNEDNEHLTSNENYAYQDVQASEGIDPTWDAGVVELIDIAGTKTWVDDEEEDRPESITVKLYANGEEVDETLVTGPEWTFVFVGLDKYDENGEEIVYTIDEVAVEGYETDIDGFDITNTKEDESDLDSDEVNKDDEEEKDEDGKPIAKTATNQYNLIAVGLGLIALGTALFIFRRRRTNE